MDNPKYGSERAEEGLLGFSDRDYRPLSRRLVSAPDFEASQCGSLGMRVLVGSDGGQQENANRMGVKRGRWKRLGGGYASLSSRVEGAQEPTQGDCRSTQVWDACNICI